MEEERQREVEGKGRWKEGSRGKRKRKIVGMEEKGRTENE